MPISSTMLDLFCELPANKILNLIQYPGNDLLIGSMCYGFRNERLQLASTLISQDLKRRFSLIPKVVRLVADRLASTGLVQPVCGASLIVDDHI